MAQNNTNKSEKEIALEMLKFALYAAIPITITIIVAFTFGVR